MKNALVKLLLNRVFQMRSAVGTNAKQVMSAQDTVLQKCLKELASLTNIESARHLQISNFAPLFSIFFKMACERNLDLRCDLMSGPGTSGGTGYWAKKHGFIRPRLS